MRTETVSTLPTPAAGLRYALPSGILVLALGFWHGGMPGVTELFGALTLLFGGVCGAFALRWSRRERALQRGAQVQLMLMAAHAESALRRGDVTPCSVCQRPVRREQNARCLFCGAARLPPLR